MHTMTAEKSALDGARQLFLIGAPRSGTTILTRLLNAHREVLLTHETAVFLQLDEMIKKSRMGGGAGVLYGKSHYALWASHLREQAKYLIESFYAQIAERERRGRLSYWGEKHPHFERCLSFVDELYPDATYIYAIRDPRDAACSIARMNGIAMHGAIGRWARFADVYDTFAESMPPDRVKVVRYEDLVRDYESVAGEVLGALGLAMDDKTAAFVAERRNVPAHNPGARHRIDYAETSLERWRRDMTAAEQAFALKKCRAFMLRHGYLDQPDRPGSG